MELYQCKHCSHFVEEVDEGEGWEHLEDGEQLFDHEAEPGSEAKTLDEWMEEHPALFKTFADGKIGPNSFINTRGKIPSRIIQLAGALTEALLADSDDPTPPEQDALLNLMSVMHWALGNKPTSELPDYQRYYIPQDRE